MQKRKIAVLLLLCLLLVAGISPVLYEIAGICATVLDRVQDEISTVNDGDGGGGNGGWPNGGGGG